MNTSRTASAALVAALAVTGVASSAHADERNSLHWKRVDAGTKQQLRGLDGVSATTAWVSGEKGVVKRTLTRGRTWVNRSPRQAKGLMLRDIQAFDARRAVTLSIGEGGDNRIFRTANGGRTWRQVFRATNPKAFYDCMTFNDRGVGLVMGDPINGKFQILRSTDWGRTWRKMPRSGMPRALKGEFGFAASGTCVATDGGRRFWFATGGVEHPRVFRSHDGGRTWHVRRTPVVGGPSAGIYSLAVNNSRRLLAVGGDYEHPKRMRRTSATSTTGGRTWRASSRTVRGYRSGAAFVASRRRVALAVGPTGSDISRDNGRTWRRFSQGSFDGVQCVDHVCWASGPDGKVARMMFR